MSASTRYGDNRRSNGSTADKTSARMPRTNPQEKASRTQKPGGNSPASGPERPAHKRTLSGNPRTNSMKSVEEREKRTDKHTVTTRDTMVSRVKSPDRRPMPPTAQTRTADGRRSAEARSKDPRQEAAPQGMGTLNLYDRARVLVLMLRDDSSLGTGSDFVTAYLCALGVSNINTTASFTSAIVDTTQTVVGIIARSAGGRYTGRPFVRVHGL